MIIGLQEKAVFMGNKVRIPSALFDTLAQIKNQILDAKYQALSHALTDFNQAKSFLLSYNGGEATFNSYRREVERLLQWAWLIKIKSIKELRREDIEEYIQFCQHPPEAWIAKQNVPRFENNANARKSNPLWRPFVISKNKRKYTLSQIALKSIFAILSSFYNYLIQENHIEINPITQIRQKSKFLRKRHGKQSIRRLTELQWDYVIETAEIMANENNNHERTLFIMTALYAMYLRISELVASKRWIPQMGHFFRDDDGNFWFKTVGKGNKERDVSVSDAMLAALKRYRKNIKLSLLPSPGETTPLISKNHSDDPIASTRHIRRLVQICFDKSVDRMIEDKFYEEAEQLKAATVHWLRHTGISDDVKRRPREHVRDDAGHSSSAITDKYIDIDLRERHASAKKKPITI